MRGNIINTANVYAGGKSELVVGHWLASRPGDVTPDGVMLATKGRSATGPDANETGLSGAICTARLMRPCAASASRPWISTSCSLDMQTPMEETLAFLDDAVSAGKIHYVGLSNFTGWELQLFVSTAQSDGRPAAGQRFSRNTVCYPEIEWEIVPATIA